MKKILLAFFGLFLVITLNACFPDFIEYDVYVTVYPMQYIVERLFEDTPLKVGIVPGVTSHDSSVDWSHKEIIAMTKASLLFYVGANYDQYIDLQINQIFTNKNVELVKLENEKDYISFILGIIHSHDHEENNHDDNSPLGYDPHFWISPLRVKQVAPLLYNKLSEKYTNYQSTLDDNYQRLIQDLDDLHHDFLEAIAMQNKQALTSTNIYGYLRQDYNFCYFSISPGYHEETEQFTSAEHEAIVLWATEANIRHIIYESNITSPLSNAVFTSLERLGVLPIKLEYDILQTLTDKEREAGKDYISIMYDNLELIKTAIIDEE